MWRIHLSDLILIFSCALNFSVCALLDNESHILDGKAQITKHKDVFLEDIDNAVADSETKISAASSRSATNRALCDPRFFPCSQSFVAVHDLSVAQHVRINVAVKSWRQIDI